MAYLSHHTQTLRKRGYRMTPQRLSILQVLHEGGHLSPGQLFERVRHTGMTETTVYRALEFLATNGIIFTAQKRGGHLTYELIGHDHHHMVCRNCGRQIEIEQEIFQEAIHLMEMKTGFSLAKEHLTFFGRCPSCQEKT